MERVVLGMANAVLYLKAEQNAEVMEERVCVKNIASVYCADQALRARAESLTVYKFGEKDKKRQIVSILKVIELIEKECQGVSVESLRSEERRVGKEC